MDLFRYLMFLLMLSAPGQVRCNAPLAQATICSVTFKNPHFVETVTPADAARIRALIEIVEDENRR